MQFIALEFLLTHCPACQHCAGVLEQLRKEFPPSKFDVLGVAVDEGAEAHIADFRLKTKATFPIAVDKLANAHTFLQRSVMYPLMMPQLVFIDKKGVIRYELDGRADVSFFMNEESEARKIITKLIAE